MIYTVTFNPSIDYIINIDNLNLGETNRSTAETYYVGGKGINVSSVLATLGVDSVALGFAAGFTGEEIIKGVKKMGINSDFITLKNGTSRINVKIKSANETEINCQGPHITNDDLNKLFDKLNKIKNGDILVLAGSIPKSLPCDIYEKILENLKDKNVKFIVDATGDLLLNVLKYKPFLVKPNNFELGEIFGTNISNDNLEEIIKHAKILQEKGAENVLVSLAEKGSVLLDNQGKIHKFGVANVEVVNSVGAGDSMLAGFIAGYLQKGDYDFALKLGTACGGATTSLSGLASKDRILQLLSEI